MATINSTKSLNYQEFVSMQVVDMVIRIGKKSYSYIDTAKEWHEGTYDEVLVLKEISTGKYVGFTFNQLKGKKVIWG